MTRRERLEQLLGGNQYAKEILALFDEMTAESPQPREVTHHRKGDFYGGAKDAPHETPFGMLDKDAPERYKP